MEVQFHYVVVVMELHVLLCQQSNGHGQPEFFLIGRPDWRIQSCITFLIKHHKIRKTWFWSGLPDLESVAQVGDQDDILSVHTGKCVSDVVKLLLNWNILCKEIIYGSFVNWSFQQPSSNFDDSGYFSIQVIQKALSVWGLELTPYQSSDPIAVAARQNPV